MSPNEVVNILGSDQFYEEWMGGNLEGFNFYKGLLIGFSGGDGEEPAPTALDQTLIECTPSS